MISQNKSSLNSKRNLLALVVILLLVAGGAYYLLVLKDDGSNSDVATEKIDLSPPTEAEIAETEQHKQNLAQKDSETPDSQNQNVIPVIGFLHQAENKNVEANGYISGVMEEGGTCTLTLTKDGTKVSESRKSLNDAQSTICGLIVIPREKLSTGEWKATITYSTSKYQGTSEERSVQVK
jgi:hypothetical protein